MSAPVHDLYATVTARIVAALERGVAPWVRPWSEDVDGAAVNAGSRRPYRGINALLLGLEANSHGYPLNRWLTYRQAAELGAQVRYGERGTAVVLWRLRRVSAVAEFYPMPDDPDLPERVIPLLRAFTVFNLAQLDHVPAALQAVDPVRWEPDARAQELLLMSGATIRHGGSRAFYRPSDDEIHLPPPRLFPSAGDYHATALHELTHWTAAPGRCNRQLGQRFGDDAYAAEELIAEMGAAFLCAHCRLDGELHHADYLASWLKVLRQDKRAIFVAATRAQQAADYLIQRLQPPRRRSRAPPPELPSHPPRRPRLTPWPSSFLEGAVMTHDQTIRRALAILEGRMRSGDTAAITASRTRLPAPLTARPRPRSVRLRVPRRPAPGHRLRRALPRHAGPDQRLPARGGEDRPGAQRRGGDLRPQPPVGRGRAEPRR